ncbi:MAG: hypothetical protein ABIP55_04175, partial [Tepidisphaeraceae bacterium]
GLFDGGGGAGLADYWDVTRSSKVAGGGFIWAFVDETVKRPDSGRQNGGQMDTAENRAPDGVVGPYREKEGSFSAIKEIWSPVAVQRVGVEDSYEVENRYHFTNLRDCTFTWQLRNFAKPWDDKGGHEVIAQWSQPVELAPGGKKLIQVEFPDAADGADAHALRVDDAQGREIWTWVYGGQGVVGGTVEPPKARGERGRREHGQRPFGGVVRAAGGGELTKTEWRERPDGSVELEYAYTLDGVVDYHGVSFDLPDKDVKSVRWLGQGPFRVWKNRLAGTTLGVWETARNETITGYEGWKYPEFAGCYAGVQWMRLETTAGPVVIELDDPSLFVQVGRPKFPGEPKPFSPTTAATRRAPLSQLAGNAWANLPEAGFSILHAIPPIGTKFQLANTTGPQGQQNVAKGEYRGRVRFYSP